MLGELIPDRSATPTTGIKEGEAVVAALSEQLTTVRDKNGAISNDDTLALLAMLLRNKNDNVFNNIIHSAANDNAIMRVASVEKIQTEGQERQR